MNRSNSLIATAIILLASGNALAGGPSLPLHRPGLWQMTMTQDGVTDPKATSQICYDAASESKMKAQSSNDNCNAQQIAHNPDGSWTMSGTCEVMGMKATSRATLVGNFDSKITVTVDGTMTIEAATAGARPAIVTHRMVAVYTRLGPCQPGQRGGDVIKYDGSKMNLLDGSGRGDNPPNAPPR
jgi:hypothetical protein